MELKEYQDWTENLCVKLKTVEDDNTHMIMGMATEIGELIDVFKKNLAYGKELDLVNIKEEIGDIMFYVASFCRINDFNLMDIINTNVAKLEARYPEKFSQHSALNRDLERERKILEK